MNFLINKPRTALSAVVILCLTIVAVRNGYWVIHDYLYDNTMTNVELKTDQDDINQHDHESMQFLQNITVLLQFMEYAFRGSGGSSSINATNISSSVDNDKLFFHTDEASFYSDFENKTKFSFENFLDIAYLTDMVERFDTAALYRTPDNLRPEQLPHTNFTDYLDNIISSDYFESVVDNLLNQMLTDLYFNNGFYGQNDAEPYFIIDRLSRNSVAFTIPIALHLNRSINTGQYDLVSDFLEKSSDMLLMYSHFDVFASDNWVNQLDIHKFIVAEDVQRVSTSVNMRITNSGVYDKRIISKSATCEMCDGILNVDDCMAKCRLQVLIKRCRCIPFTYRRIFSEEKKRNSLKFCTVKRYQQCLPEGRYDPADKDYCTPSKCRPCLTVNNNYATMVTVRKKGPMASPYKFTLLISVDNWDYVLFRAKFQNTAMEMLGVLGGNLGMFLSFSLLGVWQFAEFVYDKIKKWRGRRKNVSSSGRMMEEMKTVAFSWLPNFSSALANSRKLAKGEVEDVNGKKFLENRINEHDQDIGDMKKAIEQLRMQQLYFMQNI